MARGETHARCGGKLLRSLDMPLMAEIVETHMDIAVGEGRQIKEAEVMFLADKLLQEDLFVGSLNAFAGGWMILSPIHSTTTPSAGGSRPPE
jgi:hypothetical protein